jgi:murein DD-endopeptidase MepM/ murein hydrolase activator NlpD
VAAPTVLRHRIVFDILDTADVRRDRGTQSALDSIVVNVSREANPVLRAPLDTGEWVMGSGPSNTSGHRRALNAVGGGAHIAERFAIDWVKIGPNGNTYHDDEHRNENYWAFGQPVHSVASGEVVAAVDSIADNTPHAPVPPITLANIAGNYVTVRIGPNRYATFAHLKRGSVRVRVGARVTAGEVIGLLGNTGQSTAPHLHFQITDGKSVLASEGVPFVLDRFRFLGNANDFEENKHPNEPRRRELPIDGEVIGLP